MKRAKMNKISLLGSLAAVVFSAHAAFAAPIIGTDSIGYFDVRVSGNGTNLNGADQIFSFTNSGITQAIGGGDLSGVPVGTSVTFNTFYTGGTNGGNGGSEPAFSFTITGYGTFTATADPQLTSSTATGNSQGGEYYILGAFAPGAGLAAFSPGPASFDVSFTETFGSSSISYSGSGTFASPPTSPTTPPTPVPEPASLALLGTALLAAGSLRWRSPRR